MAVQVFDQKKFKKKDQGFLGVINIRIGDVIELSPEADGMSSPPSSPTNITIANLCSHLQPRSDAHARSQEIK